MTPEINQEWKRHRSEFFVDWLESTFARKKVFYLSGVVDKALRSKVESVAADTKSAEAMSKDYLLIEAAIATDRLVVSLDEAARRLFVKAARRIGELRSIVWVNLEKMEEQPIAWLEKGATPEKQRRLGFQRGKKQ